jgi:O-antigen/teichoic acid export membrane protein
VSSTLLIPAPITVPEADPSRPAQPTLSAPPRGGRDHLATTAWALMANTGVTAVLGMAFWALASARYTPRQLGASAALISAMMLLSVISQLDLAMGISRLLPQVRARRWRPVLGAYGVATVAAIVVTVAFVILAPRLSTSFAFLGHFDWLAVALVVAVMLWNIFALQDAVLTSARWSAIVPVENGIFGLLKIALMVVLAHRLGGQGIFVGWVLAMAILLLPVNALIFGKVLRPRTTTDDAASASVVRISDRAGVARYLAVDYAAGLFSQGYTAVLPLLVLAVLGRDANAYFYIVFMISGAVRAVAQSMSTSLVVEGAHDEAHLGAMARQSLRRYCRLALPGIAVLFLASNLALKPFGAVYAAHGTTLLRLFLLATVPHAVIALYISVERVRARVNRVVAVEALIVLLVSGGAVIGMRWFGLVGVGVAWLSAHTLVAAFVAPGFWRACQGQPADQIGSSH